MARHQRVEADVAREAEVRLPHGPHEADRRQARAEGQALRREQGGGQVQRRRQARRPQGHAAGIEQGERQAPRAAPGIGADRRASGAAVSA
jgi:hypothetical protein